MEDQELIEIKELIKGIDDKEAALAVVKKYFDKKYKAFREHIMRLSDDELDGVVGGDIRIGNIYECEDFKVMCKSLSYGTSLDICSVYTCS